jgi:hypothetical protein
LVPTQSGRFLVVRCAIAVACAFLVGSSLLAQRRTADADGPDPKVGLVIALQVGGARYDFNGRGVCTHTANGSIYDAPSSMWSVHQTGESRRLSLTLWRLKSGAEMLTLNVGVDGTARSVNTVRVGSNGNVVGSGSAKLQSAGKGGTLTIDATDANGTRITGTVKCEAFTTPVEDNGL